MKSKFSNSKLSSDIIWNVVSFSGIVIIGVLLNIIILKFYDSKTLGVFNQVYAIYLLLSQLAVGGVHLSIQYFIPKHAENKANVSIFTLTALISALITSMFIIILSYLILSIFTSVLGSEDVKKGLEVSIWGLLFFSFNKILLSVHNGLRNMKLFGFLQLGRFGLILFFLLVFYFQELESCNLAIILAFSEVFLFIALIISLFSVIDLKLNTRGKKIFKIQFFHGIKALTGNLLLDVNTKVDVISLGLFLSDSVVGIYSLAASIIEGFMQFPVILRNNMNPIITRIYARKNFKLLEKTIRKALKQFYKIIGLLGFLSMIGMPLLPFLFQIQEGQMIVFIYIILCSGFILTGGYQPFMMLYNQLGNPILQTKFIFWIFFSNLIFNIILIPIIGVYGAAVGTSLSFFVQVILTKFYTKKYFNMAI